MGSSNEIVRLTEQLEMLRREKQESDDIAYRERQKNIELEDQLRHLRNKSEALEAQCRQGHVLNDSLSKHIGIL